MSVVKGLLAGLVIYVGCAGCSGPEGVVTVNLPAGWRIVSPDDPFSASNGTYVFYLPFGKQRLVAEGHGRRVGLDINVNHTEMYLSPEHSELIRSVDLTQ